MSEKGYSLIVNSILEGKSIDLSMLPPDQRKNFDLAGDDLVERGFFLEAAKVFNMTQNLEKLKFVAEFCLKEKKLEIAFFAFNALNEKEGLDKTGEAFLQVPDVKKALLCFESAENDMMVSFIRENF